MLLWGEREGGRERERGRERGGARGLAVCVGGASGILTSNSLVV